MNRPCAYQGHDHAPMIPKMCKRLEQAQVVLVRPRHGRIEDETFGQAVTLSDSRHVIDRWLAREQRGWRLGNNLDLAWRCDPVLLGHILFDPLRVDNDGLGNVASGWTDRLSPSHMAGREELRIVQMLEVMGIVHAGHGAQRVLLGWKVHDVAAQTFIKAV